MSDQLRTASHQPSSSASRGRRGLAVLGALGLLLATAACGARWDEAQREAVLAQHQGGGSSFEAAAGTTSGGTSRTRTTTSGGTPATTPDAIGDPAAGGEGGAEAAPGGDGGGEAAAGGEAAEAPGDLPCSAPSDEVGVTDSQIVLGSISTLSGAVPGLGASSEGAARAYVAYRNATGGVCGRELVLKTADDAMDNGRHRTLINEMSKEVLGIIGGVGGGDAGSAQTVVELNLPVVNVPISEQFQQASTVFNINPGFADPNQPIGKFEHLYQQGVRKAAIVYTAVDQTRNEVRNKQKPQMIASGIEVVHENELPMSTLSYDSAARGVANSGADYLFFMSDAGMSASMARSMRNAGADLKYEEYLTAYGSNFIEQAGAAAEGTVSWTRTLPNEEPGTSPEQDAFLQWMSRVAGNVPADTFAADSWAASKAFIDNLEALPGPISRQALLDQLRSVGEYDAGGLLGPINLGAKQNKGCMILMRVQSGGWVREAPDSGFLC